MRWPSQYSTRCEGLQAQLAWRPISTLGSSALRLAAGMGVQSSRQQPVQPRQRTPASNWKGCSPLCCTLLHSDWNVASGCTFTWSMMAFMRWTARWVTLVRSSLASSSGSVPGGTAKPLSASACAHTCDAAGNSTGPASQPLTLHQGDSAGQ